MKESQTYSQIFQNDIFQNAGVQSADFECLMTMVKEKAEETFYSMPSKLFYRPMSCREILSSLKNFIQQIHERVTKNAKIHSEIENVVLKSLNTLKEPVQQIRKVAQEVQNEVNSNRFINYYLEEFDSAYNKVAILTSNCMSIITRNNVKPSNVKVDDAFSGVNVKELIKFCDGAILGTKKDERELIKYLFEELEIEAGSNLLLIKRINLFYLLIQYARIAKIKQSESLFVPCGYSDPVAVYKLEYPKKSEMKETYNSIKSYSQFANIHFYPGSGIIVHEDLNEGVKGIKPNLHIVCEKANNGKNPNLSGSLTLKPEYLKKLYGICEMKVIPIEETISKGIVTRNYMLEIQNKAGDKIYLEFSTKDKVKKGKENKIEFSKNSVKDNKNKDISKFENNIVARELKYIISNDIVFNFIERTRMSKKAQIDYRIENNILHVRGKCYLLMVHGKLDSNTEQNVTEFMFPSDLKSTHITNDTQIQPLLSLCSNNKINQNLITNNIKR